MVKNKPTVWDWIFKAATPTVIFGGLVMITLFYAEIKELVFPDIETRIRTVEHMNMEINAFELTRQADTLSMRTKGVTLRQDTLLTQQRNLDTLLINNGKLLDSIKVDNRKKFIADSLFHIQKMKSINAREYKMDQILKFTRQILDSIIKRQ